jgi:putative transcriptional regulator
MIRHHPPPDLLFDYATGGVREPVAVIVASHLSYCAECRAEVARLEAVGGALLGSAEAADMAPDALVRTLARLQDAPPVPPAPALDDATRRMVPPPLRRYLGASVDRLDWRRRTWSLTEAQLASPAPGYRFSLVRLPPKGSFPRHGHLGQEHTLVLSGSYDQPDGRYGVGDFEYADSERTHTLRSDEGCICLVVLDAGIRFTGAFGAIANPFAPKRFD